MWTDILNFLGAERYSQHAICLTNDPIMVFLYVLSDLSIWASYVTIGFGLLLNPSATAMVAMRPTHRILFGAFIFLCGMTHLTMVVTLFTGVYRLDVIIRAATGAVSVVTALVVMNDLLQARRAEA